MSARSVLPTTFDWGITVGVVKPVVLFFFQAEDGIRDVAVTGVQTCALPISSSAACASTRRLNARMPSSRFKNCAGVGMRRFTGSSILTVPVLPFDDGAPPHPGRDRKSGV